MNIQEMNAAECSKLAHEIVAKGFPMTQEDRYTFTLCNDRYITLTGCVLPIMSNTARNNPEDMNIVDAYQSEPCKH